jgi:hypothetical protein
MKRMMRKRRRITLKEDSKEVLMTQLEAETQVRISTTLTNPLLRINNPN